MKAWISQLSGKRHGMLMFKITHTNTIEGQKNTDYYSLRHKKYSHLAITTTKESFHDYLGNTQNHKG